LKKESLVFVPLKENDAKIVRLADVCASDASSDHT